MLQKQAVPENLLAVLNAINPFFSGQGFYLAEGTALALRFGHRLSVDLDFFTTKEFDSNALEAELLNLFDEIQTVSKTKGSLCCLVNKVKVEAFYYPTTELSPPDVIEGISLASLPDNACMKLSALINRGSKKDFVDIAELFTYLPPSELIALYEEKFPHSNAFMALTSLTYFDDAENDADPIFLKKQTWNKTKADLVKAVKDYTIT